MKRALLFLLFTAVVAATLALWISNRRAEQDVASQYYIPKEARITPEIELLQRYVRIDTSNPPGKELAGAQFLAGLLQQAGVKPEIIESAPGRASVYARIRGKHPNEGLLLLNHIDVVPADPKGWSHPPFAASIKYNMLYGRGALDMKSVGICALEAFAAVARSGKTPERDIVFLAEADEEADGALGIQWLLAHRPDVIEGVRYALNEGGITETEREQITYFGIEVGTKMLVSTSVRAASREQLERLRVALEPFVTPRDPERLLPEVKRFLHDLAPHRIEQQQYLNDVDRTIATGKFWLLQRPYKELMQNIVWMRGVTEGNGGATMDVLLYNLPDEDPEKRIAWLRDFIKPFGADIAAVNEKMGPAPLSPSNTPMFALLTREIHRKYGDIHVGTEVLGASSNDSRFLRPKGIACYGWWPFPVDYFQTTGVHGVDERVRLDWFMDGVALTKAVVARYAFDSLPQ